MDERRRISVRTDKRVQKGTRCPLVSILAVVVQYTRAQLAANSVPSRGMGKCTFLCPRRVSCVLMALSMVLATRREYTVMEGEPVYFVRAMIE